MAARDDYLLVAVIDFATKHSGYSFSIRDSPETTITNNNSGASLGFKINTVAPQIEKSTLSPGTVADASICGQSQTRLIELDNLKKKLRKISEWPEGLQGQFIQDNKVVVEVQEGSGDQIESFLSGRGFDTSNNITVREIKNTIQYCVKSGSHIADVKLSGEECHRVSDKRFCNINEFETKVKEVLSPSERRIYVLPFGTVGCIAKSITLPGKQEEWYIITARHNFISQDVLDATIHVIDVEPGVQANYFGQNNDRFGKLAAICKGYFGRYGEDCKAIDIALLPVFGPVLNRATKSAPMIFDRNIKDLYDKEVVMFGAVLGEVKGKVVDVEYEPRVGDGLASDCIGVVSTDRQQPLFSKKGDSGGIVVRRENEEIVEIIGLICKSGGRTHKSRWGDDRECTWVVLLKNGFDAINQEFGVKLTLDGLWQDYPVFFI